MHMAILCHWGTGYWLATPELHCKLSLDLNSRNFSWKHPDNSSCDLFESSGYFLVWRGNAECCSDPCKKQLEVSEQGMQAMTAPTNAPHQSAPILRSLQSLWEHAFFPLLWQELGHSSYCTASCSPGHVQEREAFQCHSLITHVIYWLPLLFIDCVSEPHLPAVEWWGTEGTQGLKALASFP